MNTFLNVTFYNFGTIKGEVTNPEVVYDSCVNYNESLSSFEATCTDAGFTRCNECGEIISTPALGHTLTEHSAAAATCTTDGYSSDCWSCSRCGKYFNDAGGKNVIAASSVVIPATGHNFVNGANCSGCGTAAPAYTLDKSLLQTALNAISGTYTLTFAYSAPAGAEENPVALNSDNTIYLYSNGSDYTVAPTTFGAVIMAPADCSSMFVIGGYAFGYNPTTNSKNITSLDLTNFNTENVTNMNTMFSTCSSLTSLDLSHFKTEKVTNMQGMFGYCSALTSLDLSSFNTSNVTGMSGMFMSCSQLQSLTIGNFDMRKESSWSMQLFNSCTNLTTLTLKALPYLVNSTFNTQFTGTGKTVNYVLDDNSVVYAGTNYLPAATTAPKYTRSMTSQLETLVLPFAISVAGTEDYKVYAATTIGACPETLTGTIAAGTPVLLHLNDGVAMPYALTLTASSNAVSTTLTAATTAVSGLNLTGSYAQTNLSSTNGYVLENGQFVKIANATNKAVSPFRAYVAGTGSADTYMVYTGHSFGDDDPGHTFCTVCHHTFFRYTSTGNNPVTPNKASQLLGADGNALSFTNKYVEAEGKCVMEFNEPLVTIGEEAFENCTGFTGDLFIPNSVKNIGKCAFSLCSGFKGSLTIGSSVESIGGEAFISCKGFTGSLTIGSSVESIGENAFYECNFSGTLDIPASVTSIGIYALHFGETSSITDITVHWATPSTVSLGENILRSKECTLHVPGASYSAYTSHSYWKGFSSIVCIDHSNTSVQEQPSCTHGNLTYSLCSVCGTKSNIVETGTSLGGHIMDDTNSICTREGCGHGFFHYNTASGVIAPKKPANLKDADGNSLEIISNTVTDGVGEIEFNKPLVTIGQEAFIYCQFTGDLVVPSTVTTIGNYAFGVTGLSGTITLPASLESVGTGVFTYSSNIQTIAFRSIPQCNSNYKGYGISASVTVDLTDQSYIYAGDNKLGTVSAFSYPRTVTGGNIVTFVLPAAVPVENINGKVWKFKTYEGDKFKFEEITSGSTEANVPYLVQLDESATQLMNGNLSGVTINASATPELTGEDGVAKHIGTYTKQTVASDATTSYYGFSQASKKFVKATTGTLNPFRTMFKIGNQLDDYIADLTQTKAWGLSSDKYCKFNVKNGDELTFDYDVNIYGDKDSNLAIELAINPSDGSEDEYKIVTTVPNTAQGAEVGNTGSGSYTFDKDATICFYFTDYYGTNNFNERANFDAKEYIRITKIRLNKGVSSSASEAKAYIDLQLGMDDDEATQIIRVDADAITGTGSPMYNLQGQRITNPVKGQIYIQNGKKVLSK